MDRMLVKAKASRLVSVPDANSQRETKPKRGLGGQALGLRIDAQARIPVLEGGADALLTADAVAPASTNITGLLFRTVRPLANIA